MLGAQAVEGIVLEELALDAAGRGRALAVTHQQDELAAGHAAQQTFDQRRPDESRRSGDGDPFAGERLGDHALMSSTSLPTGREPPATRRGPVLTRSSPGSAPCSLTDASQARCFPRVHSGA